MTLMYVGLFYMTNGKHEFIKSDTSAFHWFISPFILFPSVWFFYSWVKTIIINSLKLIYSKNLQMFRLVTLNLYDTNEFYRNHFNQETNESEISFEKSPGECDHPKEVESFDLDISDEKTF
jgi:hypothetical protein